MEGIVFAQKPKAGEFWDVAIIGSGPAALTASVYTTRGAASTLMLGGSSWGGQLMLTTAVDNFPGFPEGIMGPELMQKMRTQAERFGAEIINADVQLVDFSGTPFKLHTNGDEYLAKSVIIATGADTKWLGIPGEDKLRGRGVSSCAPCDAPFFKDKAVAIVGGGDSAMEEALVLTKYTSLVYVIHRRDEFKASMAMQKRVLENEYIRVVWGSEVVEMIGDTMLEKLLLKTSKKSKMANEISKNVQNYGGKIIEEKEDWIYWELPVQGVFVAIGHTPSTNVFKGQVDLDEKGYVQPKVHRDLGEHANPFYTATSVEGVFVAGDVHDYHYRQAVTAAGFGCMAGMDVLKYLDKPTPSW